MFRTKKQIEESLHTVQAVPKKGSSIWVTLSLISSAFLIIIATIAWVANENDKAREKFTNSSSQLSTSDNDLIEGTSDNDEDFEHEDDEYIGYLTLPKDKRDNITTEDSSLTNDE